MTLGAGIINGFRKSLSFTERSARPEYWWWQLFVAIALFFPVTWMLAALAVMITSQPAWQNGRWKIAPLTDHEFVAALILTVAVAVILLLPSVAVQIRRLRDANFSGYWTFLMLAGGVGHLALFVLSIFPTRAPEETS